MTRLFLSLILWLGLTVAALAEGTLSVVEGNGKLINLDRPASSVFIGDPAIADVQAVSDGTLYVSGVAAGTTNLLALDFEENMIAMYRIVVTADNAEARAVLDDAARGSVGARAAGNSAIIKGRARNMEEALAALEARRALSAQGRRVVDRTETSSPVQVSLRVRFVEASRQELRRVGVDLSAIGDGGDIFNVFAEGSIADATFGIGGTLTPGGNTLDIMLEALESEGVVQILSEPNLTTVSGRRATFRAGTEFAFPVNQGDGVITAEYKQTGVSLDFLPTVLPNDRIALEISPEVSFVDPDVAVNVNGFSAPSVSLRRAQTTVEVASGQTFAIAGLYEQFGSDSSSGVPGLRRTPVLGNAFNVRDQRRDERELIIFVTPLLADASDAAGKPPPPVPAVNRVGFILK